MIIYDTYSNTFYDSSERKNVTVTDRTVGYVDRITTSATSSIISYVPTGSSTESVIMPYAPKGWQDYVVFG